MGLVLILLLGFVAALLWLTPFCIGVHFLTRGVRGVVSDHDPQCRACGYNLAGSGSALTRCSECGANLIGVGTVRYGCRRRPPMRIALGAGLMAMTLMPTLLVALRATTPATAVAAAPQPAAAGVTPAGPPISAAANPALEVTPPPSSPRVEIVIARDATIAGVIRGSLRFIDEQTVYARLVAPASQYIEHRRQQQRSVTPELNESSDLIPGRWAAPSADELPMLPRGEPMVSGSDTVDRPSAPITYARAQLQQRTSTSSQSWSVSAGAGSFSIDPLAAETTVDSSTAVGGGRLSDDWTASGAIRAARSPVSGNGLVSPVRSGRAAPVRQRPMRP